MCAAAVEGAAGEAAGAAFVLPHVLLLLDCVLVRLWVVIWGWTLNLPAQHSTTQHSTPDNQSIAVTPVARRPTEEFMPAIHRISLDLVAVTFLSPEQNQTALLT
jgi:hypothetical protein